MNATLTRRDLLLSALASAGPLLCMGQAARAQSGSSTDNDTVTTDGVGVIFIGASWCAICKPAAAMLAAMAAQSSIPVLVASQDARPIPPFPEFVDARDHALASQVAHVPHTLVFAAAQGGIVAEISGYRSASHYAALLRRGVSKALQAGS